MSSRRLRSRIVAALATLWLALTFASSGAPARAATLVPVTGAGSTWSSNAMDQWITDVNQYGIKIDFAATGSSDGRTQYKNGTVDFGVSEIPYGVTDNGTYEPPPTRPYAYMPIVAGGTSFMYQLHINGQQVTNLRLSGDAIAKIFTGNITEWNDPELQADNPGIVLPDEPIVPVVRSDGSGTTAQLTTWMSKVYPTLWNAYCGKAGRITPCGVTSTYPVVPGYGFVPQQLSTGVAGYVSQSQSEGTIGYVETSYAKELNYPVAKMLNAAGYYTEPTAQNVAVSLTAAQINTDPTSPSYLTQVLDGVYANPDPRTYPLSSYSYMIIPTTLQAPMTSDKGYTLGKFAYYFLCEGQQSMGDLGYSPLPINLVQAALTQVAKIPGVDVQNINIAGCDNPTFSPDGTNLLATTAPQPLPCDKQGVTMCPNPTGGATTPTYVAAAAAPTTTATPTVKATTATKAPPKRPSIRPTKAGTKPAAGASPGASPTTATTSGPARVVGPLSRPTGRATGPPAVVTATAPARVKTAPGAGVAGVQGNSTAVVDPGTGDAAAPTPVTTGQAAPGAAVVADLPPVRAVAVSVAATTGWTLQDTLMVLAVLVLALVVVGPPLLSRRLGRRRL